jgi:hypothetical protein
MAERWHAYDVGWWNPGERDHAYIGEVAAAALQGELTDEWAPVDVLGLGETANLLKRGVMQRVIERAGLALIPGPSDVPDGRKLSIAYNPERVTPVGDPFNVRTQEATRKGRRNGRRGFVRFGNKYLFGQEFRHRPSGRTPVASFGHVSPSVNLNMAYVREDNRRTAEVLAELTGAWTCIKDWNFDLRVGAGKELRREFLSHYGDWVITCGGGGDGFRHLPTWPPREIDWGVVKAGDRFRVTGKDAVRIRGREQGGESGHSLVVVHTELLAA